MSLLSLEINFLSGTSFYTFYWRAYDFSNVPALRRFVLGMTLNCTQKSNPLSTMWELEIGQSRGLLGMGDLPCGLVTT